MNRILLVALALTAMLWALPPVARAQQVICNQVGGQVLCSNGQSFNRVGNVTIDNQGHVYNSFGDQTIGSQGDIYTQRGNQTFDNRGNSWTVIGNQQVGPPPGTKCAPVGNQIFCSNAK